MVKTDLNSCMAVKNLKLAEEKKIQHHTIPSNVVLAGSKVLTGTGAMIIINVGKNSAIGKIQELITSEEELTPL